MKWLKPLLLLAALGHIVIGLYFVYAVDDVARLFGFDMLNTGSRGELRALAGGLGVAIGAMVLRGTLGGQFGRQWLYAAAIVYTGLLTGRVVSLGMDGLAAHTVFAGLFEAALAVLFFWAGAEVGRPAVTAGAAPEAHPVPVADADTPLESAKGPAAVLEPVQPASGQPAEAASSLTAPHATEPEPSSSSALSEPHDVASDGDQQDAAGKSGSGESGD